MRSEAEFTEFISLVWDHYKQQGRHDLPWRRPSRLRPYPILVSELMLQQTQVERVVPKYLAFLRTWPSARALAAAERGSVIRAWQGLGYNRRAKYLHELAQQVTVKNRGQLPRDQQALRALPGVGPYTAAAVQVFAYNQPKMLIETNVRQVYFHHFFTGQVAVSDQELVPLIERTVSTDRPREWYWALMDYGSYLKRTTRNLSSESRHYVKQSPFKGSDREIRGAILRQLSEVATGLTTHHCIAALPEFSPERIKTQLVRLAQDGLVRQTNDYWHL